MNALFNSVPASVVTAAGWTLVHFLWQGALLAFALGLALALMTRASANARYLSACATLALMAVAPAVTFGLMLPAVPLPTRPSLPGEASDRLAVQPHGSTVDDQPGAAPMAQPQVAESESAPREAVAPATIAGLSRRFRLDPFLPWFVAAWLAGVFVLSLRLAVGWIAVQRAARTLTQSASAELCQLLVRLKDRLGVGGPVRLVESARVEVPTVIGWLRPVILLPLRALTGLTPVQLEAILAHEIAHIRRHDYLVNLIQTVIETLLFYHPAVWWVARRIREEREHCCDDLAVWVCGDRTSYVRALLRIEELRPQPQGLAMAADGGSLLVRTRRLLGRREAPGPRPACWLAAVFPASIALALFVCWQFGPVSAKAKPNANNAEAAMTADNPAAQDNAPEDSPWGPVVDGLRCRLVPTLPTADEQMPDPSKRSTRFERPEDIAFVVEVQNTSDKPVKLVGVRYSDSYAPPHQGKSNSNHYGPVLFDFDFIDATGKPVERTKRELLDPMLLVSGMAVQTVAPGQALLVLLRPGRFESSQEYRLGAGTYRARVRYGGPAPKVLAQITKTWPKKEHASAWTGELTSGEATFTIAPQGGQVVAPPIWGQPVNGLRAALQFRRARDPRQPASQPAPAAVDAADYPLGVRLDLQVLLQNVGQKPIQLVSETWRQEDRLTATNEAGEVKEVTGTWYSGWPIMFRWTLQPGQSAELAASNLGIAATAEAAGKFEHPTGRTFIAAPGKYTLVCEVRLGHIQQKDKDGKVVVPGSDDWQGTLNTGAAPLLIRQSRPGDFPPEPRSSGRLEFRSPDGKPVLAGTIEAWAQSSSRRSPIKAEIKNGVAHLSNVPAGPLTVDLRAPGFEETRFFDVTLKENQATSLTVKTARPSRFRLVSSIDGRPVAGASVRFFNRTASKASAGPYPTDGTSGPVWTQSDANGVVVLDTLQTDHPQGGDIGVSVYWFYVEATGLAPRFIGPVLAGQDLGDKTMGPLLEAAGEMRGSVEELSEFQAEWDQPELMQSGNPAADWLYAVSQRLETKRIGDKLTFRLTGLRPGRLRIICNFGRGPHSIGHTYTRRDVRAGDVVFETELKESARDLVITPSSKPGDRGGKPKPAG